MMTVVRDEAEEDRLRACIEHLSILCLSMSISCLSITSGRRITLLRIRSNSSLYCSTLCRCSSLQLHFNLSDGGPLLGALRSYHHLEIVVKMREFLSQSKSLHSILDSFAELLASKCLQRFVIIRDSLPKVSYLNCLFL